MNRSQKVIAIFGLTTLLSLCYPGGERVIAQSPVPTPSETQATPSSEVSQPDFKLLVQAITEFYRGDRYQTESTMRLQGTGAGLNYISDVLIKTIAQPPNQFRSEITFSSPNRSDKISYLVVSDGKQVWIYRNDTHQYAVADYQKFARSNDSFLIGLSSQLFLETSADVRTMLSQSSLSEESLLEFMKATFPNNNSALQGKLQTVESKNYYVYHYTDPGQGFIMSMFLEPETAQVQQLEIFGKVDNIDIQISEKIISRIPISNNTSAPFQFLMPEGATQVEEMPINMF